MHLRLPLGTCTIFHKVPLLGFVATDIYTRYTTIWVCSETVYLSKVPISVIWIDPTKGTPRTVYFYRKYHDRRACRQA